MSKCVSSVSENASLHGNTKTCQFPEFGRKHAQIKNGLALPSFFGVVCVDSVDPVIADRDPLLTFILC